MLHIRTTPDKSRIIGYSINNLGMLKVNSLIEKAVATKSKLVDNGELNKEIVVTTSPELKPKDYWSVMASLVVYSKPPAAVNIVYTNPPKQQGKPNKFEAESRRLTV